MPTSNLTKKQKEVLDFILKFKKEKGYSPSLEEIAEYFDVSIPTIHQHIQALKEKGMLSTRKGEKRSISLKDDPFSVIYIPLVGTIAAGQPIEAIEVPDESIAIPKNEISRPEECYALRVKGDSMIKEGIFDGDIVIVRKQPTADDGQTVVAIIDDNEATLKKIYKEKDRIRLQPANQEMLPIFRREVEIRGVVVKIIRNIENTESTLSYRKKGVLNRIKSSNPNSKNKYKRVVETPIRYAGGKSLAVGYVVELLPDNIKRLVSPFFGGGSVEIACNKYLGLEVVGYDIFDILVNYWKIQIEKPKELYKRLSSLNPDKETYNKVKEELKAHWKGRKKLPPLELATYYYFNHNLSYGPGFLGWPSKVYLNKERYKAMIEKVRDFSVSNLKVECASFEEAFEKYPNDFFYCDPPYFLGGDSKMFIGIYPMRNFPVHHNNFDHEKLRDLLKKHKGGFILSYNNCSTIREWYKDFEQHFPSWQYTMGQGETRIGENRKKNGTNNHVKESHEILIYCPPRV